MLFRSIIQYLQDENIEVENLGVDTTDSIDYPDKAVEVSYAVLNSDDKDARGILICGTGIGMSISANKIEGIRAALVTDCYSARMAKEHNNANVITLGARTLGNELAKEIVKNYLSVEFLGGRHANRVDKIDHIMTDSNAD